MALSRRRKVKQLVYHVQRRPGQAARDGRNGPPPYPPYGHPLAAKRGEETTRQREHQSAAEVTRVQMKTKDQGPRTKDQGPNNLLPENRRQVQKGRFSSRQEPPKRRMDVLTGGNPESAGVAAKMGRIDSEILMAISTRGTILMSM
jgi:hypothetical protein